jgi:FixJ family two-component response regulator
MPFQKDPPVRRGPTTSPWRLTPRETEVMDLILIHGMHKVVADKLGVTEKAIDATARQARIRMGERHKLVAAVKWARWRDSQKDKDVSAVTSQN